MDTQTQTSANYDRKIISAETAARMEREGDGFKTKPLQEGSINTVEGFTVDREGLLNNYAIEPEMYINEPGDLREKEERLAEERARQRKEINQEGGRGVGII